MLSEVVRIDRVRQASLARLDVFTLAFVLLYAKLCSRYEPVPVPVPIWYNHDRSDLRATVSKVLYSSRQNLHSHDSGRFWSISFSNILKSWIFSWFLLVGVVKVILRQVGVWSFRCKNISQRFAISLVHKVDSLWNTFRFAASGTSFPL